jgi:hypothetical protein
MAFDDVRLKNLEKGKKFEEYIQKVLEEDPRYGDVFLHLLGLADEFEQDPFYSKDQLLVLGGFGVLAHMIYTEGPEIVPYWRGSHDLDVACASPSATKFLENRLGSESHQSLSLPDKKRMKIHDRGIDEVLGRESLAEVDLYYPDRFHDIIRVANHELQKEDFEATQNVSVYGVKIPAYRLSGLMRMKLGIITGDNLPRNKDMIDIINLLGVYERSHVEPEMILLGLTDPNKDMLMDVLKHEIDPNLNKSNSKYVITSPTIKYLSKINEAYQEDLFERKIN